MDAQNAYDAAGFRSLVKIYEISSRCQPKRTKNRKK